GDADMARKDSPRASAWDKISGKKTEDTIANRDVYEDQQLDRSTIQKRKTKTSRVILSAILGVIVAIIVWAVLSLGQFGFFAVTGMFDGDSTPSFVERQQESTTKFCYAIVDENGDVMEDEPCYKTEEEAQEHPPKWVDEAIAEQEAADDGASDPDGYLGWFFYFHWLKAMVSGLVGFIIFAIVNTMLMR